MFCPQCGSENTNGLRFCRSCGQGLQGVALARFAEQTKAAVRSGGAKARREKARGWNPLLYALFLIVLGLSISLLGRALNGADIVQGIGGLMAMLGVGLLGFKGVMLVTHPHLGVPDDDDDSFEPEYSASAAPRELRGADPHVSLEQTTRELDPAAAKKSDH